MNAKTPALLQKPKGARQGKSAPDHPRLVPAGEKSDSYQLP